MGAQQRRHARGIEIQRIGNVWPEFARVGELELEQARRPDAQIALGRRGDAEIRAQHAERHLAGEIHHIDAAMRRVQQPVRLGCGAGCQCCEVGALHHSAHGGDIAFVLGRIIQAEEKRIAVHDELQIGGVGHAKRRIVQKHLEHIVIARDEDHAEIGNRQDAPGKAENRCLVFEESSLQAALEAGVDGA